MTSFDQDALDFLAELAVNNNREWFEANRKRYESGLKKPVAALVGELIVRMREFDPEIDVQVKDAVFRINRDTRFRKDADPYKTNYGFVINREGKHAPGRPGLYVNFDAETFSIGGGHYFLLPEQLLAIRKWIADHPEEFERLVAEPAFVELYGEVIGQRSKVLPTDLKAAAERQPLIFNKQFFFFKQHPASVLLRDDLSDFIMHHVEVGWPLSSFLSHALE